MEEYGLGCLPDKKDIRDYKINKKIAMAVDYPKQFECNRSPLIKQQRSVGSCVAHATSEILEAYNGGEKLSTNFIYGIHKKLYGTPGPGMYLRDACKIVSTYGDPSYDLCPGNTEVSAVYKIAEEAFANIDVLKDAAKYKIDSYVRLRSEDDIKYALTNYGPVLIAVMWYKENKVSNGVLIKGSTKSGGHALMLYGWNEQGWLIQNSWGSS